MDLCEGFRYSGTQWGQECWCGGDDTNHQKHEDPKGTSDAVCDDKCTGNDSETCGGFDAMEVREFV